MSASQITAQSDTPNMSICGHQAPFIVLQELVCNFIQRLVQVPASRPKLQAQAALVSSMNCAGIDYPPGLEQLHLVLVVDAFRNEYRRVHVSWKGLLLHGIPLQQ